eukprot:TRINITY_DN1195_c0_g1_i1.p1 TRINITY_DN1195_c0_g1~~TRINITY_DN1195_c0_g1_i1.p1  ORF type:complete len:242 (-),score=31.34 TRINITY_DN1195_c0_g1_i1:46-726(-)
MRLNIVHLLIGIIAISLIECSMAQEPDPLRTLCYHSTKAPAKPSFQFTFCKQYQEESCCLTGHDADIDGTFQTLVDVGSECPYRQKSEALYLRQWMCIGCSPNQFQYVNPENTSVMFVCDTFANKLWGQNGTAFDECGLRITVTQCGAGFSSCGDNVVVPSHVYKTPVDFLNNVHPANLYPDFSFEVVKQSDLPAGVLCFDGVYSGAPTSLMNLTMIFIAIIVMLM